MNDDEHRLAAEGACLRTGLSVTELWIRCFELGGRAGPMEIEAYLHGLMPLSDFDRDVLAYVLNELMDEQGIRDRVPYSFGADGSTG